MKRLGVRPLATASALLAGLLLAQPALALRCGSKLVTEGMHEVQVVAICGEPVTRRHLGYTMRGFDRAPGASNSHGWSMYTGPAFGALAEDVAVTEYVYNFGPRKFMRRLVFEGGLLVSIEPLGYGYRND